MENRNILATYRDSDGNFTYDWLTDEELDSWLEDSKSLNYTQVQIARVSIIEKIYESEDIKNWIKLEFYLNYILDFLR